MNQFKKYTDPISNIRKFAEKIIENCDLVEQYSSWCSKSDKYYTFYKKCLESNIIDLKNIRDKINEISEDIDNL